ncbi:MAG: restriction endonuclease subunit S [Solirubrobacteraceae bacterium]
MSDAISEPTLSELCSLIVDSEHKTAPKDPDGLHPLMRTTDLGPAQGDFSGAQRVNAATYELWTRRARPQTDDLILAREAPVGGVCQVPADVHPVLGQRTVLLRPQANVDSRFLMYRLAADDLQARMSEMATGATVPHLNMADIRAFKVPDVPEIGQQRRRAAILGAFDELTETNERRIEVLEELARSLYREWFVRFRFPGSSPPPASGEMPRGWRIVPLGELCDVIRGRSYRSSELSETEGVLFLNLKCVGRGGGFRPGGLKRYTGRFKDAQRVTTGDVLVAVTDMTQERRIVAQAFRVPDLGEPLAIPSLDLVVLSPLISGLRAYLYAFLRYSGFGDRVRHFANGANVLHLAVERILEEHFVVPDEQTLAEFTHHIELLLDEGEFLAHANRRLAAARDLLLPRLVTGRLDISDIDLGDLLPAEAA